MRELALCRPPHQSLRVEFHGPNLEKQMLRIFPVIPPGMADTRDLWLEAGAPARGVGDVLSVPSPVRAGRRQVARR